VQAKIKAESTLATEPIRVATASAVVTLTGEVSSAANKARAEELAKGVEGVKSVVNNLTVKVPVPVIAADDPLKTQVMANLAKYGITGVTVTVANSEVTLTGDIPRAKLQDAMKAANEAHPKKVNNKLTIK
jgi:osmotically-inducible protein OsmY